ncbi:MAG: flagellar hook-associated protein FlgK, partial [Lachnospiraceae bacterium]|nr:flagellar hook-associated protein FlgK [Lachnospiraceae bacterium]
WLKLEKDVKIFRDGGANTFLQCIYADVTVDTQECTTFTNNFTNIQKTIQNQRESVSGVDEDEEALDLVKFQNAYNLSSKVISVLSEMYDQLILRTGV